MTYKEIVAAALDGWTRSKFCASRYAEDREGFSISPTDSEAVKWCVVGRFMMLNIDDDIYQIGHDFKDKYGKGIMSTSDGWFGYWRVKRMLRKLYV